MLFLLQEEARTEEKKADPFTRRKTLPQLVAKVCCFVKFLDRVISKMPKPRVCKSLLGKT